MCKCGGFEMTLYLIGMMFTAGYLSAIDALYKINKFDGITGTLKLIFLCIIWPFAIGDLLARVNLENNNTGEGEK